MKKAKGNAINTSPWRCRCYIPVTTVQTSARSILYAIFLKKSIAFWKLAEKVCGFSLFLPFFQNETHHYNYKKIWKYKRKRRDKTRLFWIDNWACLRSTQFYVLLHGDHFQRKTAYLCIYYMLFFLKSQYPLKNSQRSLRVFSFLLSFVHIA